VVTDPTDEQLRTPQPEDPTFTVNRDRLRVLNCVVQGRVRRTRGGKDTVAPPNDSAGFGSRIRVCDMWAAGLLVLAAGDYYDLTAAGARRRQQAITEYDAQRAGGAATTRPIPTR
jgi:hypothetical protein